MLFGFYSIVFSYKRLDRPGVSHQMRRLFLFKHAVYVVVLTLLWLLQLMNNYHELYYYQLSIKDETILEYLESDCFQHYYKQDMPFVPNQKNLLKFCYQTERQFEVDKISYFSVFFSGWILVLIRIFDPFYRQILKKNMYELFGYVYNEDNSQIKTQVLSSFLASSLNIELVYIILAGITRFSHEQN